MQPLPVEIEAVYTFEKHRFGDVAIIGCRVPTTPEDGKQVDVFGDEITEKALTIKLDVAPDELVRGLTYRFFGHWSEYRNKRTKEVERQFTATSFATATPHGKEGITAYLRQAPHIGPAIADRLWETFGSEAVKAIRERTEEAAAACGMTAERAKQAAEWLIARSAQENCQIDLIGVLGGRGFPRNIPQVAVQKWGVRAGAFIRRNPYILMQFHGCGFKRCDALYLDLGLPPERLKRQVLCICHALNEDKDGHTWFPLAYVLKALNETIAGTAINAPKALKLAKRARLISSIRTDGPHGDITSEVPSFLWLTNSERAIQERIIANCVAAARQEMEPTEILEWVSRDEVTATIPTAARCTRCHRRLTAAQVAILGDQPYGPDCIQKMSGGENAVHLPLHDWLAKHPIMSVKTHETFAGVAQVAYVNAWPVAADLPGLSDHQRDRLSLATIGRIGILGGSPGTGKSYTAAALIRCIVKRFGEGSVAVCAPTGKAAVRMSEAMNEYELPIRARTIHSLLRLFPSATGEMIPGYGPNKPLPYKFIVVDEASMIDADLMARLLSARGRGTHVLLVGDVNQLPPVGHGAPLRDLINANLPYGGLREIRRNSGMIVEACTSIRDGRAFATTDKIDLETGENLRFLDAPDPETQTKRLMNLLAAVKAQGFEPVWDCQILVPLNARSLVSRRTLNASLQNHLNPTVDGDPLEPFRVRDKVVCLKNGFYRLDSKLDERGAAIAKAQAEEERTGISIDWSQFGDDINQKGEVFVANGELAEVVAVEDKVMTAKLANPDRIVRVPKGKPRPPSDDQEASTGCNWDLGYALSVHKSQGSEWPIAVVMIDESRGASMVCSREWVYTAISRAKKICFLIGRMTTALKICRRVAIGQRKTFLRELITRDATNGQ